MTILQDSNSIYAYSAYMTKFMPADSEKFERVDEIPNDGNVPKAENNDCHCYDLEEG
jgi:hypothetical protein